jgi:ribokinase
MRCFVVGNVTIDTTFAIEDFPKAGVSIHGRELSVGLGGKGCNQAIVFGRAGLDTTLIAAVGDDSRGSMIRSMIAAEPIRAILFAHTGGASDASTILSAASGDNANITTAFCAKNLPFARTVSALGDAASGDLLVLQGNLTDETTFNLLKFGRALGMATAFNPSPLRQSMAEMLEWVDIVFLNEAETLAMAGTSQEAAAHVLLEKGPGQVVITMGSGGAILANAQGVARMPAQPTNVVDTTGAGDTFMATALASAALRNICLDRTAMMAAAEAAALTVGRVGTQAAFPTVDEMAALLGRSHL